MKCAFRVHPVLNAPEYISLLSALDCCRGIGVALTGVSFGLLEEGTHAYFTILYWENSSRLL